MLFIGSIFAVIASAFIYRSSRENWPVLLEECVLQVEYALLAIKEIIFDWVNRKNNKNGKHFNTFSLFGYFFRMFDVLEILKIVSRATITISLFLLCKELKKK